MTVDQIHIPTVGLQNFAIRDEPLTEQDFAHLLYCRECLDLWKTFKQERASQDPPSKVA
jgi:hypothetical protein